MKHKLLLPLLLACALFCAPGTALAAEWTPEMFTWDADHPTMITGLSDVGYANITENKDLVIPEKNAAGDATTEIASQAFSAGGNKYDADKKTALASLTSVSMPDTITKMGMAAFNSCASLSSVKLSAGLTEVPASAFLKTGNNDAAINELVIPEGVQTIGTRAFAGCKVGKVTFPSSLQTIGNYAFLNHQLTQLKLSENVTSVGSSAFSVAQAVHGGLPKTLEAISLDSKLTSIGANAFQCSKAKEVVVPVSVTTLNRTAFAGGDTTVTLLVPTNKQLTGDSQFVAEGTGHIVKGDLSKATVSAPEQTATGNAVEPEVTVTFDGETVDPANYQLTYANNVFPGTATVTAKASDGGKFAGSTEGTFQIALSADGKAHVGAVDSAVAALPAVSDITADNAEAQKSVEAAIDSYNALSDVEKSTVSSETKSALLAAQSRIVEIKKTELTAAQKQVDAANKKATEAESKTTDLQTQLANAQEQLKQAKADKAALQKKLASAKSQNITAKGVSKTYKAKSLKKKAKSFKVTVKAKGKVSYQVIEKNGKLSFKNGKVTVKKHTKAGTYKMKIKVKADAKGNYQKAAKNVTIKVKVTK